jgi:hypothetical protein
MLCEPIWGSEQRTGGGAVSIGGTQERRKRRHCCLHGCCVDRLAGWNMSIHLRRMQNSQRSAAASIAAHGLEIILGDYWLERAGLGNHHPPEVKTKGREKQFLIHLFRPAFRSSRSTLFRNDSRLRVASPGITANRMSNVYPIHPRFGCDHMQNKRAFARTCLTIPSLACTAPTHSGETDPSSFPNGRKLLRSHRPECLGGEFKVVWRVIVGADQLDVKNQKRSADEPALTALTRLPSRSECGSIENAARHGLRWSK